MPRITVKIGGREPLRAQADACPEAADLAEEYDADPAAYEEREEAARAAEE